MIRRFGRASVSHMQVEQIRVAGRALLLLCSLLARAGHVGRAFPALLARLVAAPFGGALYGTNCFAHACDDLRAVFVPVPASDNATRKLSENSALLRFWT